MYQSRHQEVYHSSSPDSSLLVPLTVFFVIPVHSELSSIKDCVRSILAHPSYTFQFSEKLILVNYGSHVRAVEYIKDVCPHKSYMYRDYYSQICSRVDDGGVHYLTTGGEHGFSYAAQKGIDFALNSTNNSRRDVVVVLDADTIVTEGWVSGLYNALVSSDDVAMVGPVTNSGGPQSFPAVFEADNHTWSHNPFPLGVSTDQISNELYALHEHLPPVSTSWILHGMCIMYRLDLFRRLGSYNTSGLPLEYDAQIDFSMRVHAAGYQALVVPHVYIFHARDSQPIWISLVQFNIFDPFEAFLAQQQQWETSLARLLLPNYTHSVVLQSLLNRSLAQREIHSSLRQVATSPQLPLSVSAPRAEQQQQQQQQQQQRLLLFCCGSGAVTKPAGHLDA